mgnify:CR=1 FL=1
MNLALSEDRLARAHPQDAITEAVYVAVRIPKSGSESLAELLRAAFPESHRFYLPSTYDADGQLSLLQRLRFLRSRGRNLMERYRTLDMHDAYEAIEETAQYGDLIEGGHIDFPTVRANIGRKLRIITLLRDPAQRSLSEYNYARQVYERRHPLRRFTVALISKIAGTRDYDGFLDFMEEHRAVYGDIASRYIGWDGVENLSSYFARSVFHAGVLEDRDRFARELSEKLGKNLAFPHQNRTVNPAETAVTAAQRTKIEKIYARDMALYLWTRSHI